MVRWISALLIALFSWAIPHANTTSKTDYVGLIAAEAAYASLLPSTPSAKPKVPTKDCQTCHGTGRVRSGDDQGWTKCPDCEGKPLGDVISR